MKIAPIIRSFELKNKAFEMSGSLHRIQNVIVHSGQHYDSSLSDIFLQELNIRPDVYLSVGSGSHAEQTAKIMMAFESVCLKEKPDLVLLVGDVNTTLAGALVASKIHIPIAHVEAGLRSFDRSMPEEINRVLTDSISDLLFITEMDAQENLIKEGILKDRIFFVGNVMIDSLLQIEANLNPARALEDFQLQSKNYALVTLHRPESVDNPEILTALVSTLNHLQEQIPVIFPIHPRAKIRLDQLQHFAFGQQLQIVKPLSYPDFISLIKLARFVITDSGGIQEETTALNIPCITVRKATERPITVTMGTNVIAGLDPDRILGYCNQAIRGEWKSANMPPLWDGHAAGRIVDILRPFFWQDVAS
jgi:UDP-N-acetylglucosamine 2-epimerase (non-hydrolysing)